MNMKIRRLNSGTIARFVIGLACAMATLGTSRAEAEPFSIEDARMLSPFGGRANFSPDGERIVFVGKTYGDAYEIEIASGKIRNLTGEFPHQGIVRIQFLPDGNYLVTAPRVHFGPNTRAHLEMWFLHKSLEHGLQPLGASVFEGVAVSRKSNLIGWTAPDPTLRPDDNWQMAFARPTTRHIAEVEVSGTRARLVRKRAVMESLPEQCSFVEPQDFRLNDTELVYSCMSASDSGSLVVSVMGHLIKDGSNLTYRRKVGEYNEVEGISPDESWATVECGKQETAALPELDICRLDLRPDGKLTKLVAGRTPGSSIDVSNPVVSPNGKWLAFQKSDSASPDIGGGFGLFLIPLQD